jgi:hypothetical protein
MKFLAEDFNRPKFVTCFEMVNYQAVFKNGIHARLLAKLTQYTVIIFWRNVDQYFQGPKLRESLSNTPVRVISF